MAPENPSDVSSDTSKTKVQEIFCQFNGLYVDTARARFHTTKISTHFESQLINKSFKRWSNHRKNCKLTENLWKLSPLFTLHLCFFLFLRFSVCPGI